MISRQIINITGSCGKTTTASFIYTILTKAGLNVGLASTAGLFYKDKILKSSDQARKTGFEILYKKRKKLDTLICETVLRPPNAEFSSHYPAPADMCLVTNVYSDHLEQTKSKDLYELAEKKLDIVNFNKNNGLVIINADNRYLLKTLEEKSLDKVILFSLNKNILQSLKTCNPKKIYFFEKNSIKLKIGKNSRILINNVKDIPVTLNGKAKFNIYNLLASIVVIDNLQKISITNKKLQKAIKELDISYQITPGRLNIYNFKGFKVILDFAQNPQSYKEIFKTVKTMKSKRIVSVLKASSTKPIQMIKKLGEIAAKNSDVIYVKESFSKTSKKRNKYKGRIANMLKEGIEKAGFSKNNVYTILLEENATKMAIRNAQVGDIVLILGYRIHKLHKLISSLEKESNLNSF